MRIPPWMEVAFFELNKFVVEIPGPANNNPHIMRYLGCVMDINTCSDEVPWCACFVEYCLQKAGFKGTGKPNARSYSNYGMPCIAFGAIVVLWRDNPESALGHIGFKIAQDQESVYLLGGNQNDSVNISKYPVKRILTQRFPYTKINKFTKEVVKM